MEGAIAAAGFASGDRFVVGLWEDGPFGPMTDVMWADPNGVRTLLVPDEKAGRFIGGVYNFESTRIVPISVTRSQEEVAIEAGPLCLRLTLGKPNRLFSLRPRFLRRSPAWVRVEDSFFRPLVGSVVLKGAAGVRGYGVTESGVREWYAVDSYRPLVDAEASLDGSDLGPLRPLTPPVRFGFSEFPAVPAFVGCAPVLEGVPADLLR